MIAHFTSYVSKIPQTESGIMTAENNVIKCHRLINQVAWNIKELLHKFYLNNVVAKCSYVIWTTASMTVNSSQHLYWQASTKFQNGTHILLVVRDMNATKLRETPWCGYGLFWANGSSEWTMSGSKNFFWYLTGFRSFANCSWNLLLALEQVNESGLWSL